MNRTFENRVLLPALALLGAFALSGCFFGIFDSEEKKPAYRIHVVDEEGAAFPADTVVWYTQGGEDTGPDMGAVRLLKNGSAWGIKRAITGPFTIEARYARPADDTACARYAVGYFTGEGKKIRYPGHTIRIALTVAETCE